MLIAGDQWIAGETRIEGCVFDHHHIVAGGDRVGAEGEADRRFLLVDPEAGFEPLPLQVDQRHQGDRRLHKHCGQARQTVKIRIGRRIQRLKTAQNGPPAVVAHDLGHIVRKVEFDIGFILQLDANPFARPY